MKSVSLAKYTSFKIGGKAKYFFEAKNKENLILYLKTAKKKGLTFFILGNGSNLLVSDKGFNGVVIKMQDTGYKLQSSEISAFSGISLGKLVNVAARAGLSGLEWAFGIPGTLGGAIFGNAGAFKQSMKGIVLSVEVLDAKTLKVKSFKNKDCKFYYRESVFGHKENLIIVSAVLRLKRGNKSEIREKIKEYSDYRIKTQPLNYPSAGSVFKNPKGFFAAKLIEDCGLKGKKIGKAKVSEKHANFIVNLGGAKEKDVKSLIKLVKEKVKKKFGVVLEEEIRFL